MNINVMKIARINLQGNTLDQGWFKHLTLENGKPYMVAITILSEIFYWYKPTEIKDERTNKIQYKQKFKADKLQKSYQQLAESFGFTKRQVKDACKYLEKKNLITMEFRTIVRSGKKCNNVMYVEPNTENIEKISIIYQDPVTSESDTLLHSNVTPSDVQTGEALTLERKTNTKITTENTTEITTNKKKYCHKFETCDVNAAKYLFEKIKSNNPKQKEPNFISWSKDFRLMREKDQRELQEIKDVIDWCQADPFWKGNILSPKKLREKFDQLTIQMNARKGAKNHGSGGKSDDEDFEYIGL
ncbi:DNA replication protein DnaD [Bacillus mycoides]|uniref:DNA replication protein DnaD n=1 Tax=Bacillus mycoides TaxID=1405 RepID=A0A1W6AGS1_BACMY|nr:DNA replication protein DnaD [Bacillus mycoides]ARJ25067.1 DNA replication protein DnaD [Bacillus mycoides]ARJ25104.1 DNA replication protein DnaD [Bacillus mycoides]